MAVVTVSIEGERGCGYRSSGLNGYGIYLMAGEVSAPCGMLPWELKVCPCCGAGIKPSRGWTWIEPGLFDMVFGVDEVCDNEWCHQCPVGYGRTWDKAGLIWIGERFYKTGHEFLSEAQSMGISRKLAALPRDFEIGETWVFFAHRKGRIWINDENEEEWTPAIFSACRPSYIDLVIDDENDVPEYCERLQEKYGPDKVRVVKVVRDYETQGRFQGVL